MGAAAYGLHADLRAGRRRQQRPGQPGDRGPQLRRRRPSSSPGTGRPGCEGVQGTGVGATAKHFPGHGDTAPDSHLALPVVDRLARRAAGARAGAVRRGGRGRGARAVMTSHLLLPQVDPDAPATFSRAISTGLLRDELGFGGRPRHRRARHGRRVEPGRDARERRPRAGRRLRPALPGQRQHRRAGGGDRAGRPRRRRRRHPARGPCGRGRRPGARDGRRADRGPDVAPRPACRGLPNPGTARRRHRGRHLRRLARGARLARPGRRAGSSWSGSRTARTSPSASCPGARTSPSSTRSSSTPATRSTPTRWAPGPVLVLGRDVHRHPGARAVVDRLRPRRDVLVVDLGWPSPDRAYADVATFGASRRVGAALLGWLRDGRLQDR